MSLHVHSKRNVKKTPEPSFWTKDHFRLFISHVSSDKALAQSLKKDLDSYAISGFVAHSDIEPSKEWESEIVLGLNTCDSGIALMSHKFHESKWTDQEIGILIGQEKLIVPIKIGLDPYGFIGKYQALPFSDEKKSTKDIFNALVKNEKTKKKMAYALMAMFENSDSFSGAKINFDLVKKIEFWNDDLIERLEKSSKGNSQIRGSFGLPASISYLVKELRDRD